MIVDCLAHVHSSFSYDSVTDLTDIVTIARKHGIGSVLISEHNNTLDDEKVEALVERCGQLSSADCLLIPGLELSLDENRVHLLAYGVRQYIPSLTVRALRPLIRQIHTLGGVAVLAHPAHKAAYTRLADADLRALDGMEVWNVRNGSRYHPHSGELSAVRRLRRQGVRMAAFAGLDWHFLSDFERVVLRVHVARLDAADILRELGAGCFLIQGRFVSFNQDRELGIIQRAAYAAATRSLLPLRRTAYRLQARLEKRGFRTPHSLARLARRIL